MGEVILVASNKKRRSSERRNKDLSGQRGSWTRFARPYPQAKAFGRIPKNRPLGSFLDGIPPHRFEPRSVLEKREEKIGPLSPIRPKGSERKPGAPDCPAAWPSVLRYAPSHAQGARCGARLPRSVRSPQTKKRRSSERRNKDWSGQRGSNPRPPPWQGGALPTEPCPQIWRREPDSNRW